MSDSQKPAPPVANQTIQLDALDPAEAEALTAGTPSEGPGRRKTPPPLPPSALVSNPPEAYASALAAEAAPAPVPSRAPSAPPPAPRPLGQKIGLAALFVVLVAGAVYLGLEVGTRARGPAPAAAASASAAPSGAASDQVLTLPTIEMSAPQGSK